MGLAAILGYRREKVFFALYMPEKNRIRQFWPKKPKFFSYGKKAIIFSNLYMLEGVVGNLKSLFYSLGID
jgi:hypothetical protein